MNYKKFFTKFLLFFSLSYFFFLVTDFLILRQFVSSASFSLLALLGKQVWLQGTTIITNSTNFVVVSSCTGVVGFSVFFGLFQATPIKRKAYLPLVFGVFLFWNVLRITLTLSLENSINLVHDSLWFVSVLITLVLYNEILKKEKIKLN